SRATCSVADAATAKTSGLESPPVPEPPAFAIDGATSAVRDGVEVGEPGGGLAVARRPPVAARRERAAGADFRRVRQRAALVLRGLEETREEHAEPALDLADAVAAPLGRVDARPGAPPG